MLTWRDRLRLGLPLLPIEGGSKYEAGAIQTLASTELNALANNAAALGVEFDNTLAANLWFWGLFELAVTFAVAPTADSVVEVYIITAPDGTNYEDGSATGPVAPVVSLLGAWVLRAVTTAQRLAIKGVPLPPTKFKLLIFNKSGQAFPATGSTVKMVPYRTQ